MCFNKPDDLLFDSLSRPIELTKLDESLWSDKCDYYDPNKCTDLNPNQYNLIIMQLNIRSILAHQYELTQLLHTMSNRNSRVDIVLLCETFLSCKTVKLVNIPGYELVYNNRISSKGGGVGILIRNGIPYKRNNSLSMMIEKELESVYIDIATRNGSQIRVGSVYRSPNTDISKLIEHLESVSAQIKTRNNHELIIGMDQNLDLLKSDEHASTRKFLDTILDNELWPVITRPTRITQHSATLIDNIYISKNLQRKFDSLILIDDITDHLPTIALLRQTKITDKSPIEYTSRKLNDKKIQQIHRKLLETDWNGTLNSDDVNVNTGRLMDEIKKTMDTIAPLETIRILGKHRFSEPWLTKGLEAATRKNRKLYKKTLHRNHLEEDVIAYKKHRNLLNRLRRTARQQYYNNKSLEYKNNTKKLWALINQTIKKCKNGGSIIPYITVDGIQTYNPNKISNTFGKFYATMGEQLASKIIPGAKDVRHFLNLMPRTSKSLVIRATNVTEVERLIKSLPNKTSYGHDKISNILLKSLNTAISYPLVIIFNQSIHQGIFPEQMKLAEVVPLYKGKEHDIVINYRPISLLMTISKVLEKLVYQRLQSFLELHGTLFDSQYGFRARRSCEQAILEMIGNMLQMRNKGLYNTGTFLDLSKAFDTLNHTVLTQKMETYGIRGVTNDWFKSYLHNRQIVAKVTTNVNSTTYSEPYQITYGTAQGSCLGPLLFILFCNDIKLLPLYGKLILFADDTTLLNSHQNKNFLRYSTEHDLEILMNWFKANQLSLNLSKTVQLNFWEDKINRNISVSGTEIPLVTSTKFLGVYLDNTLSWKDHVSHLHNKLMANKNLLATSRNLLSIECLKSVYYAHINSHLTYGLIIWGPMAAQRLVKDLTRIQDACIRIASKSSKWTTVKPLYKQLRVLQLPEMIKLELAKYGYKISHKLYPSKLHAVAESNGGLKQHRYPTRYKTTPNIQKHRSMEFNNSHLCKGIITYNNLPTTLKKAPTLKSFIKGVKNHYLSTY